MKEEPGFYLNVKSSESSQKKKKKKEVEMTNRKQNKQLPWQRTTWQWREVCRKYLQFLVSSSVHTYLLLVLQTAMLPHVMEKLERRQCKQPSSEFNVPHVRNYSTNVFPSPNLRINSFLLKSKTTSSERRNFFAN